MNVNDIKIEENVEAPKGRSQNGKIYRPLFSKLVKPNQSFPFPIEDITAIRAMATNATTTAKNDEEATHIPRYTVRTIDEEHGRVWLLENEEKEKPKSAPKGRDNRKASA